MPIYEYSCQACGQPTEQLQKISDPPLTACPHCGEQELRKLVSAAGFRLKGAGWYETDFKGGAKRNVADSGADGGSASSGAPASASTAAKKGEAKPDSSAKGGSKVA